MKKTFFLLSLATAGLLSACSSDEPMAGREGELRVSATLNEMMTRVDGASWTVGDQIGVSDDQGNLNVLYSAGSTSGEFTSDAGILVKGNQTYSFTAYYPYSADLSGNEIAFNVVDDNANYTTEPAKYDFMFASAVQATRKNPSINLRFSHSMAKIAFTLTDKAGALTAANCQVAYTLSNVATEGTFNVSTGAVTPGATTGIIKNTAEIGKQSAVFVPSYAEGNSTEIEIVLEVTVDGETSNYTGRFKPALLAGNQYNYSLEITYGKELSVSTATITDMIKNDEGNIDLSEGGNAPVAPHKTVVGDYVLTDGTVVDWTADLDDETKARIAGVVYYVGNPQPSALYSYTADQDVLKKEFPTCTNGLALAVNNAQDAPARMASRKFNFKTGWYDVEANAEKAAGLIGTGLNLSKLPTEILGFNNTTVIKEATAQLGGSSTEGETGMADLISMLDAYQAAHAVTGASSWYVPSYAELLAVQTNYATVSASIAKAGGSLPSFADFATTASEHFYWSSDLRGETNTWISPLTATAETVDLYIGRNSNNNKGYFRFAFAF